MADRVRSMSACAGRVNLNARNCQTGTSKRSTSSATTAPSVGGALLMSDSAGTQSKSASRSDTADKQTLAHVEKWLAVIREISGERPNAAKVSG